MSNWTILKLIEWTTEYFGKAGVPNPRLDAELLLAHTLNKKRIDLYLCFDKEVDEKDLAIFKGSIQRRAKREPLQYILGTQDFCGVQIKVTPDVLIPRPETEILAETAINLCKAMTPPISVLDLCTGSGAIVAAMANRLPEATFVGVDISEAALGVARENTAAWSGRIELLQGDLYAPLSAEGKALGPFDLITANPPYISESDMGSLQAEVRDHEPRVALVAGQGGLAIIEKILDDAPRFLKSGGAVVMEVGEEQAFQVKDMAGAKDFKSVEIVKDYSGVERIVKIWIN